MVLRRFLRSHSSWLQGAWWAVLAQILLIIGAAVFCGATPAATSTGAIIMMIGFTLW